MRRIHGPHSFYNVKENSWQYKIIVNVDYYCADFMRWARFILPFKLTSERKSERKMQKFYRTVPYAKECRSSWYNFNIGLIDDQEINLTDE